jgi:Glycosyltransferases involved in cell wall biogenesis
MNYDASIIVPIYNEFNSLKSITHKIKDAFKDCNIKYIFIDDGSSDGSMEWLKENLKKIFKKNNFELINLDKNFGKGYAIKQGIKKVEGIYTLFIDSDLEYQPQDLYDMYSIVLKNKDIKVFIWIAQFRIQNTIKKIFS